jgi:hypothetical protein
MFATSDLGPSSSTPITLPSAVIYVHWGTSERAHTAEWDLTVHVDPGDSVGEYLALFNGTIDGSACYLGLQTDIFRPDLGRGIGKGLIFSTWWSFDANDTRVASDGFGELGTHEGRFVGIRRPYAWTAGDYRVALSRSDAELVGGRVMDWFDLSIEPVGRVAAGADRPSPVGPRYWIGAIRFPRRHAEVAAAVETGGVMFVEVYSRARSWGDVAPWRIDVMAYANGARCPSGRIEYPRPYGEDVPGVSARYDATRSRIDLKLGFEGVSREPAGRWP